LYAPGFPFPKKSDTRSNENTFIAFVFANQIQQKKWQQKMLSQEKHMVGLKG